MAVACLHLASNRSAIHREQSGLLILSFRIGKSIYQIILINRRDDPRSTLSDLIIIIVSWFCFPFIWCDRLLLLLLSRAFIHQKCKLAYLNEKVIKYEILFFFFVTITVTLFLLLLLLLLLINTNPQSYEEEVQMGRDSSIHPPPPHSQEMPSYHTASIRIKWKTPAKKAFEWLVVVDKEEARERERGRRGKNY